MKKQNRAQFGMNSRKTLNLYPGPREHILSYARKPCIQLTRPFINDMLKMLSLNIPRSRNLVHRLLPSMVFPIDHVSKEITDLIIKEIRDPERINRNCYEIEADVRLIKPRRRLSQNKLSFKTFKTVIANKIKQYLLSYEKGIKSDVYVYFDAYVADSNPVGKPYYITIHLRNMYRIK